MHWRIKGMIQKVLSHIPAGDQLHYLLQRKSGGMKDLGAECAAKIDDWRLMIGHMRALEQPIAGTKQMELGTGWYPTFPFCTYLAGAAAIYTYDLNRHLRSDLTTECLTIIGDNLELIIELGDRSAPEVRQRFDSMLRALRCGRDLEEASEGCIRYSAPGDARETGLADSSIDWTFSNSVLEHVPGDVIIDCMREAYRILKPGGFMFHSVNCGDHYAYVDPSISQLNYLRFSEQAWKRWNNRFLYQNRLRAKDLIAMAKEAGFVLVINTAKPTERRLEELRSIPVSPHLRRQYTTEELCITTIDMVGQRPSIAD